ncbi:DUF2335 domain-containing protein [Flavihumibacter stibioxidans]|uniref:DUF2335 domain-containing protein n=1 Tax=Flavihumibacter stibioxidans TaxID=1834163 RepID=A0ABR7MAS6_9BACT|nr:DUF2335 domain-containing protein [Flavihumibacter stibioxidans]MBC6491721.1 hypothetical protein [Flavihumibacter stibioxidans]
MSSSKPHNPKTQKTEEEPNGNGELMNIEREIEKVKPNIFKGIPQTQKRQILSLIVQSKSHRGPIPSPEDMEEYGRVIPDGANRIMAMAEKQQEHRIELEKFAVKEELSQSSRGQIFALIMGLSCLLVGGFLVYTQHDTAGSILFGTSLTTLVIAFIVGKVRQRNDLKDKQQ